MIDGEKWIDYDYIRIPIKNCLECTDEQNNPYKLEKHCLTFLGEPIFEKEVEKTTYVDINSNGISIGGIVKDDKLFDDNFIVFPNGVNKGIDIDCLMPNNHNEIKKCEIKVDKPNNIIGGKNMNELLNIYKKNEIDKIDKKYNKIKEDVLRNDEIVKAAEDYNIALKNNICDESLIYEYKISTDRIISTASKNELRDIEIDHEKECQNVCDFIKMVESHLDMADTFEQKQGILKAYGIIDEKGILKITEENEDDFDYGTIELEKAKKPLRKLKRSK